nr:minichromosome maintenance component complex 5-like protein [Cryptomonas curvata]
MIKMSEQKNFLWIEINFKNFLFKFSSLKYKYKYRKTIELCASSEKATFEIFMVDLKSFNFDLYEIVIRQPLSCLKCFEFLVSKFVNNLSNYKFSENKKIKSIQILLIENEKPMEKDKTVSYKMNGLVCLKLNIVMKGKIRTKIIKSFDDYKNKIKGKFFTKNFYFKNWNDIKTNISKDFFSDIFYNSQIKFIDYQFIKAQDEFLETNFDNKFSSFTLLLERNLVNKLNIGNKYIISGIYIFDDIYKKFERKKNFFQNFILSKNPILKVLGFYSINDETGLSWKKEILFSNNNFFLFSRSSSIYDWIYSMILPGISNIIDIKQGIACMLFGGKDKFFSNNYRFRSEINVLLVSIQPEFNSGIFDFLKIMTETNINLDVYKEFKNISNLVQLRNYLNKKEYPLKNNFFSNLNFFCLENFEKLDKEEVLKISKSIENQSYYNKNKINSKKDSIRYSFIFSTNQTFFKNKLTKLLITSNDVSFKIFSKFDLIFFPNKNYLGNNNLQLEKQSNLLNGTKINAFKKSKLNSPNSSIYILKKYIEFTRNNFSPDLSKNAAQLLKQIYTHLRLIQKNQKSNKLFFFTKINLNKLESIIRVSESLSKMRASNLTDCNIILDAVRIIQKIIITIDKLMKL